MSYREVLQGLEELYEFERYCENAEKLNKVANRRRKVGDLDKHVVASLSLDRMVKRGYVVRLDSDGGPNYCLSTKSKRIGDVEDAIAEYLGMDTATLGGVLRELLRTGRSLDEGKLNDPKFLEIYSRIKRDSPSAIPKKLESIILQI